MKREHTSEARCERRVLVLACTTNMSSACSCMLLACAAIAAPCAYIREPETDFATSVPTICSAPRRVINMPERATIIQTFTDADNPDNFTSFPLSRAAEILVAEEE